MSRSATSVISERAIDRFAAAHDASHYLFVPQAVARPRDIADLRELVSTAHTQRRALTFRAGGTSLSGQSLSDSLLVDVRGAFRRVEILDGGERVRVQPGATVRQVNARLARHGRKLGPDPASEIACTVGGVIADNSSGMACGITQNSYQTLESLVLVLADGTEIDTAHPDAEQHLRERAPHLHEGLASMRERLLASPAAVARVRQQFSMKNTMGYGLNSLLDFDRPLDILTHLVVGSEGTLAFIGEAVMRTVEVLPQTSTGLLVFPTLRDAAAALPELVAAGFATIELLDATSLRVCQATGNAPAMIADLTVTSHTALLVEFHASDAAALDDAARRAAPLLASLPLTTAPRMTTDAVERAALWSVRKGLYPAVAGARPSGTTALLEDIVVPVDRLADTCEQLIALFDRHGYEGSVIFGHAKDGNLHFMLNERFDDPACVARYRAFTENMVELVLAQNGSLKAEHGTGRVMAPFVRRQYGDELYAIMVEIKRLFDPAGILNPGVIITDDPDTYVQGLKLVPPVESEVDRCVECGFCEPTCPSKDVTLTPRQRIVLRREIARADAAGEVDLVRELRDDYDYDGVQTCAVDGMCAVACPVKINTGDLVRRLRAENRNPFTAAGWNAAARAWGPLTRVGGLALDVADALPSGVVSAATDAARAVLGHDTVPRYDRRLPGGGAARPRARRSDDAQAVFFSACVGAMFGTDDDVPGAREGGDEPIGATAAFLRLAERAGISLVIPEGLGSLCCGTPWKSKGMTEGYHAMTERVLPALLTASDGGRLPIVCDAASCTEGLETMRAAAEAGYGMLRFVDATEFTRDRLLAALHVTTPVDSIAVHPTCSTTALGVTDCLVALASHVSDDVVVPVDWGCCGFAGDRGMLHPELTASATAREAAEVAEREFGAYVSANRTCELGMSRATGKAYRHILEVVERATR